MSEHKKNHCCCPERESIHMHHEGCSPADAGAHEFILWTWIRQLINKTKDEIVGEPTDASSKDTICGTKASVGECEENIKSYIRANVIGDERSTISMVYENLSVVDKKVDAITGNVINGIAGEQQDTTLTSINNSVMDGHRALVQLTNKALEDTSVIKLSTNELPKKLANLLETSSNIVDVVKDVDEKVDKIDTSVVELQEVANSTYDKLKYLTEAVGDIYPPKGDATLIDVAKNTENHVEDVRFAIANSILFNLAQLKVENPLDYTSIRTIMVEMIKDDGYSGFIKEVTGVTPKLFDK